MAPVNVFVAARGNAFMTEIAQWIVEAARLSGRDARMVDGRLPHADGSLNLVVAPHEFFELFVASTAELQRAAAASVCIGTEQPGTTWFDLTLDAARLGRVAYDINAHGVDALRAAGVDAHHLRLGAVPSMLSAARVDRTSDALFIGGLDQRRGRVLADLAPLLVRRGAQLHLSRFDRPIRADTPGAVFGADKHRLLSGSRTLLNIHRARSAGAQRPAYFEWARMVEAMANRCVVVSEPSDGYAPLVAGVHFVEACAPELGATLDGLLDDPQRLRHIADAAFETVSGPLALRHSVGRMLDHLEHDVVPRLAVHAARRIPRSTRWRLGSSQVMPPVRLPAFRPFVETRRRAKSLAMAESADVRRIDGVRCLLRHGAQQHVERVETFSYATARPAVTVAVSLYNYADAITNALTSVAACEGITFEVVVVDDHATDRSRAVVREFLDAHPDVPMVLLGKDANEGLAAARNTAFAAARADLVMVLDADNSVYPNCLRRLADALGREPDAAAAYGILEDFGDARNVRSAFEWDVRRLCEANYIDAQAMIRRSAWQRLGGYRGDAEVFGWEDWDLWLRLAGTGGHARLVPEILGRYRVGQGSMIALTNLGHEDALAAIRLRHPALPWPEARQQ